VSEYIHGYSAEEQERLTLMQRLINDAELRVLDLSGAERILDVGAGLAQMSRAIARAAGPEARVVGVERDPRQIREAKRLMAAAGESDLVELREGRAEDLPLAEGEWKAFDLAHARFLLEHVTDPFAVVKQMVAAVRPGGRVALLDDDHDVLRLWPTVPTLERAWEVYWRSYSRLGCDPIVGRRLPALLYEAGAPAFRVTTVFYGACAGTPLFEPVVENLRGVLAGATDGLAEAGLLAREEIRRALEALDGWRRDPTASVWYSLPFAEGRKPER
jgi:ubiquinone/menaquinone biosynthesis C-methylase UbiE